ncbi:hypothetical protein HAHE_03000 [Haloferula helveola]|uniref:Uncharacterized protein n=1 Tax=Haloferula helveola TaxID=490095 RepID=A0ABM7RA49_9BACT|nr:hypothetical protein HAHE_03000 [Haloferula helveola]
MKPKPHPLVRAAALLVLLGFAGVFIWNLTRPAKRPSSPRIEELNSIAEASAEIKAERRDAALVRQLIEEDLGERRFRFPTVIHASSGCHVLRLDPERPSHKRILDALGEALGKITEELARPGSAALEERRINEVSRHFEDALKAELDAVDGLACTIPPNRDGEEQRSGYPDLQVTDEQSGEVFYLDPKLVENTSWDSSFRSFYFEPKDRSLKITKDAVHLLVGIGHNGEDGRWVFGPWKIVDLSSLALRLKPEFQASNRDLYPSADP